VIPTAGHERDRRPTGSGRWAIRGTAQETNVRAPIRPGPL
jgi:hypothetical protein